MGAGACGPARFARGRGRPLFSYLSFDSSFTEPRIDLGRADARRQHDEILGLLT